MSNEHVDAVPVDAGRPEKRTPRSIRYYDHEWAKIEAFAEARGAAPAEFVRFVALAAIEDGGSAAGSPRRLAPLIERTFRYAYMIATNMRDEMRAAGRSEELEVLIGEARALQNEVSEGAPDTRQVDAKGRAPAGGDRTGR